MQAALRNELKNGQVKIRVVDEQIVVELTAPPTPTSPGTLSDNDATGGTVSEVTLDVIAKVAEVHATIISEIAVVEIPAEKQGDADDERDSGTDTGNIDNQAVNDRYEELIIALSKEIGDGLADIEILAEAFAVELAEGRVQIDADDDRIKVTVVEQDKAYTDSERTPGKKGARINQNTIEIYAKLAEARSLLVSELIVAKQVSEDAAERLRRKAADAAQKQSDIEAQFQQLQLVLSQQIESGAANIVKSDERFIITLEDKGLFLSGTADLDPSILSTINQIADTIAQSDSLVRIQGHSDNRPCWVFGTVCV